MNISNLIFKNFMDKVSDFEPGKGNFPFRKRGTDTYLRGISIPYRVVDGKILNLMFVAGELCFPTATGFYTNPVTNIYGRDTPSSRRLFRRLERRLTETLIEKGF